VSHLYGSVLGSHGGINCSSCFDRDTLNAYARASRIEYDRTSGLGAAFAGGKPAHSKNVAPRAASARDTFLIV
jgi:hypothetical protein